MTKFLVDECVDQKAVRAIPAREKGFEIIFPQDRSFKGAADVSVAKLAQAETSVFVTADSDFDRLHLEPGEILEGVVWLHPKRSSKRAIHSLLKRFCRYQNENSPANPYDFRGQMIEVEDTGMHVSTAIGTEFRPWPASYSDSF